MLKEEYLGQDFHGYRITGRMASGERSDVFLAYAQGNSQKTVILKVFAKNVKTLPERQDFLREVRILTTLEHSHILPILDVGIDSGCPYLVMEHESSGSLHALLARTEELSVKTALDLIQQLAEGLDYLHAQKLAHGNLKAENILMNDQQHLVLSDLKLQSLEGPHKHEQTSEELQQQDLLRLVYLAYEILTGHKVEKVASETVPPSSWRPALPHYFDTVFTQALATAPDQHFTSGLLFVKALLGASDEKTQPDIPKVVLPAARSRQSLLTIPQWRKRRPRLLALSLCILLLITAVSFIPFLANRPPVTAVRSRTQAQHTSTATPVVAGTGKSTTPAQPESALVGTAATMTTTPTTTLSATPTTTTTLSATSTTTNTSSLPGSATPSPTVAAAIPVATPPPTNTTVPTPQPSNQPQISGQLFVQGSATASVNLSQVGTTDWAHWGLENSSSFNHKGGVTQYISNFSAIGGPKINTFADGQTYYSWNDGTPIPSCNNTNTGVYVTGANNGFEFSVPSETISHTLRIYVSVFQSRARLSASLTDGSTPAYIDAILDNSGGASYGVYTITYRTAYNGQRLNITYTMLTNYNGNITLQAAALQ